MAELGETVLLLPKNLKGKDSQNFWEENLRRLGQGPWQVVTLDWGEMESVNAQTLKDIFVFRHRLIQQGIPLRVTNCPAWMYRVLKTLRLNKSLNIAHVQKMFSD